MSAVPARHAASRATGDRAACAARRGNHTCRRYPRHAAGKQRLCSFKNARRWRECTSAGHLQRGLHSLAGTLPSTTGLSGLSAALRAPLSGIRTARVGPRRRAGRHERRTRDPLDAGGGCRGNPSLPTPHDTSSSWSGQGSRVAARRTAGRRLASVAHVGFRIDVDTICPSPLPACTRVAVR